MMSNFFFTSVFFFYFISLVGAIKNGITMDLIHRDSPLSPLRKPNATRFERLQNMLDRSVARRASLSISMEVPLEHVSGEYLVKIFIGTPSIETSVILDTGSDLLWTPCLPCTGDCSSVNLFDPSKSTTYRNLSCEHTLCRPPYGSCDTENNICRYDTSYRDESHSKGVLSSDTISLQLGFGLSIPFSVVFGCGHDIGGTTNGNNIGIMGLGLGDHSFLNQLQNSFGGMFSYCLSDDESNGSGKLSFGSNALVSGLSTPLIRRGTDYYLNLEGVTVETTRLDLDTSVNIENRGNIMIDSGTTFTNFGQQFYQKLKSEIVSFIEREPDPEPGHLCYSQTNADFIEPKIVFHFTDADLELRSRLFVQKGSQFCLTMEESSDNRNIFGNSNQKNYHVGYDLVNMKVSFAPTDC